MLLLRDSVEGREGVWLPSKANRKALPVFGWLFERFNGLESCAVRVRGPKHVMCVLIDMGGGQNYGPLLGPLKY